LILPLSPRVRRQVALVKLSGKRDTQAMELVSTALLTLRGKSYDARSAREH
jgi:hypothetical protein